jgi:Transposase DDE domain
LSGFLDRIKHRYGQANRIWVMDRGIPTEDSLSKMRSIGASYLVGTPKGRLSKLEQSFLSQPWAKVRDGVQVKRLATDEDVYVLAQSDARIGKERGMRRKRLRQVRRREGRYLLRTNLTAQEQEPTDLWRFYIQPTEVEPVFKEIKHDLAIRPIFHKTQERIEAHIFVAFLAYCLQVTLQAKSRTIAGGTTPHEVIAKFKTMQMVDVHLPTTDGRELTLSR